MDSGKGRPSVALVIGSGGIKCAAALGVWKLLQREGIDVSVSVGCSGGSLYAAAIALGDSIEAAEEASYRFWSSDLVKGYPQRLREVQAGTARFNERSGLAEAGPLDDIAVELYGERTFADTRIPLHIVATDLYTGERVVLTSGRVSDAVRASVAIPTIFPAWEVDGRLLVDGAVSDPLPVDVAIRENVSVIIAMGFELSLRPRINSITAFNSHVNTIYTNNLFRASFAFHNLAHHDEIVAIIPEFDRPISSFDTQHVPYIIEAGERAAEAHLPYLRRLFANSGT